jgi:uncharacterized membrane protein YfcA
MLEVSLPALSAVSAQHWALGSAAFIGGVVSGFAGFAFSAAAGAILLHFMEPRLAVPLMMVCSIISQITSLAALRRFIRWQEILPLLLGGALGVPIALYMLMLMDARVFRVSFGVFLAAYALYMFARPATAVLGSIGRGLPNTAVGFAGGLIGGLTAMPGALPTIWCDLRGVSKERQRGMVQPFILAMQALAVVLLILSPGALHPDLLKDTVLAIPALTTGTLIGILLFGKIDDKKFRYSILTLLLVSGCLMVH